MKTKEKRREGVSFSVSLMGIWVLLLSEQSAFWNSYISFSSHRDTHKVSSSLKTKWRESKSHFSCNLWVSILTPDISRFQSKQKWKGSTFGNWNALMGSQMFHMFRHQAGAGKKRGWWLHLVTSLITRSCIKIQGKWTFSGSLVAMPVSV